MKSPPSNICQCFPLNSFHLSAHYCAALFPDVLVFVEDPLTQVKKAGGKRMSDTLIKRSSAVIMTHLSAAPDPNSYSTACGASLRGCICLWGSITALIPGGLWHIFQWGAIKTPAEAVSRRTTCRKICRRIRWS